MKQPDYEAPDQDIIEFARKLSSNNEVTLVYVPQLSASVLEVDPIVDMPVYIRRIIVHNLLGIEPWVERL